MASRGRLIKTTKARHYLIDCIQWSKTHQELKQIKEEMTKKIAEKKLINLDAYFIWPVDRVFTKGEKAKSWIRQIDAHNRLKQLHDALMNHVLEIDDSFIFSGQAIKMFSESIDEPKCFIEITYVDKDVLHFNNLRSRMINEQEAREKTNRV